MTRGKSLSGFLAFAAALLLAASPPLQAQPADRYLDSPAQAAGEVRLVVFNPIVFNLRGLENLRRLGYFDVPGLVVVGVYHAKQTADFQESRRYAREHNLDWVRFHVIDAPVNEKELFRANTLTPEFERVVSAADGVIFFGGPDIPPSVYGEKTNLLTEISDPYRHYLEVSAAYHLIGGPGEKGRKPLLDSRPDFPVLGICLGFQTLNVGAGGTLIQDIWSELYDRDHVEDIIALGPERWHNNPYRLIFPLEKLMTYNFHTIDLKPASVFCREMGFSPADHPRILSSHHQAVKKLGAGLRVFATSRDGRVIEAFGHERFANVLGIQFHPEHPLLWDRQPQFRQKPGDEPTSYFAILDGAPPSVAFNRKIWEWFADKLVKSRVESNKKAGRKRP